MEILCQTIVLVPRLCLPPLPWQSPLQRHPLRGRALGSRRPVVPATVALLPPVRPFPTTHSSVPRAADRRAAVRRFVTRRGAARCNAAHSADVRRNANRRDAVRCYLPTALRHPTRPRSTRCRPPQSGPARRRPRAAVLRRHPPRHRLALFCLPCCSPPQRCPPRRRSAMAPFAVPALCSADHWLAARRRQRRLQLLGPAALAQPSLGAVRGILPAWRWWRAGSAATGLRSGAPPGRPATCLLRGGRARPAPRVPWLRSW